MIRQAVARCLRWEGLAIAALLSAGSCDGEGGNAPAGPDPGPSVGSVTLTPSGATLEVGESLTLTATVRDPSGAPISQSVSWSSTESQVATVGANGIVRALAEGTTLVVAAAGPRSDTAQILVVGRSAPPPPSDLAAMALGPTRIHLSWSDNSSTETGFQIERETAPEGDVRSTASPPQRVFLPLATVGPDVTSFLDETVEPGGAYRYTVLACNETGCSAAGAPTGAVATPGLPPGALAIRSVVRSPTGGVADTPPNPPLDGFGFELRTAGTGELVRSGLTSPDGSLILIVPPGTYDLFETDTRGLQNVTGVLRDLVVQTGEVLEVEWVNWQMEPQPGTLMIRKVVQSAEGRVANNPFDPPLAGFAFEVREPGGEASVGDVVTDASGVATIAVPPGTWEVIETDSQGLESAMPPGLQVQVPAGGETELEWINRQPEAGDGTLLVVVTIQNSDGGVPDNPSNPDRTGFQFTVLEAGTDLPVLSGGTGWDGRAEFRLRAGEYDLIQTFKHGTDDVTMLIGALRVVADLETEVSWINRQQPLVPPALEEGVPLTGLTAIKDSRKYYTFDLPPGVGEGKVLQFRTRYGTGDVGLRVQLGVSPNGTGYCWQSLERSYVGTVKICSIANPAPGRWHVEMEAWETYSDVALDVSLVPLTTVADGEVIGPFSADATEAVYLYYPRDGYPPLAMVDGPPPRGTMRARLSGGTGDPDLRGGRRGVIWVNNPIDCVSNRDGPEEECVAQFGRTPSYPEWVFAIFGESSFEGVSFVFEYLPPRVKFRSSFLPGGYIGTDYTGTPLSAIEGDGTYSYAVTDGRLPEGVTIDPATGSLAGVPTEAGLFAFEITASSAGESASALFTLTISTAPPEAFNVVAFFPPERIPDAPLLASISEALAKLEAAIIGDVPAATLPASGFDTSCSGAYPFAYGQTIDDFLLFIDATSVDGVGGLLGAAGGCGLVRGVEPVGVSGQVLLDSDDMAVQPHGNRVQIIWHEMAHAVGFSPVHWLISGVATGLGGADPRFTGERAAIEFGMLGGVGMGVPLEADFGPGSRDSHWDEACFGSELMTPLVDPVNYMSRLTIAALADVGWATSFDVADPYALPGCSPLCASPGRAPGIGPPPRDFLIREPLARRNPDGTYTVIPPGG